MNKKDRLKNTEFYEYLNVNPKGKYGGDCVVRAIANTMDQSWEQTIRELTELGIKMGYVLNDEHVFTKYLEAHGFVKCNEPRDINNRKITVKDWFIQMEGRTIKSTVAIVGSHHVTSIKNGKVNDIWNCSNKIMHRYWKKEE